MRQGADFEGFPSFPALRSHGFGAIQLKHTSTEPGEWCLTGVFFALQLKFDSNTDRAPTPQPAPQLRITDPLVHNQRRNSFLGDSRQNGFCDGERNIRLSSCMINYVI